MTICRHDHDDQRCIECVAEGLQMGRAIENTYRLEREKESGRMHITITFEVRPTDADIKSDPAWKTLGWEICDGLSSEYFNNDGDGDGHIIAFMDPDNWANRVLVQGHK